MMKIEAYTNKTTTCKELSKKVPTQWVQFNSRCIIPL